jgi:ABC-type dipeptide/oligopeptide/nickel transport system permease component
MRKKDAKHFFKQWVKHMDFDKSMTTDKDVMDLLFEAFKDGFIAGGVYITTINQRSIEEWRE